MRICVRVYENREEFNNDSELKVDLKKSLKADDNFILIDPKYGEEDFPDDSVHRCLIYVDFLVKEKIDTRQYFKEHKDMFLPRSVKLYFVKIFLWLLIFHVK